VFGDVVVGSVAEVLVNWESLKQQEKESRIEPASALDGISPAMPSLARAQSIQRHADRTAGTGAGVEELIDRLSAALSLLTAETSPADQESGLGELLFGIADLARRLDIDAESALREANSRFERRYREAEAKFRRATFADEQAQLPQLLDGSESPGV
jgi:uncharacterized protein YabN with tetrapyrrole methylase and pyrophosphatase domain